MATDDKSDRSKQAMRALWVHARRWIVTASGPGDATAPRPWLPAAHVARGTAGKELLLAASLLLVPGTALAQPFVTGPGTATNPLYVDNTKLWRSRNVPVCWETAGSTTEKGWVQTAITNTWQAHSQVQFTGWAQCPETGAFNGIRIQVADTWPRVDALGRDLNNVRNGMKLNFTFGFVNDGKQPFGNCSGAARQFCIETIAVHEFGHALGFAHEQNRTDALNFWCQGPEDQPQGSDGTVYVGTWDLDSVMNYCNPNYGGIGRLSAIDVEGVQRFYGAPASVDCSYRSGGLEWSCSGAIAGATCVQIAEGSDPHTWNDNFLCAHAPPGGVAGNWPSLAACNLRWSNAGPIAGARCTQISESAEPADHTWNDNFLCVADSCAYHFTWSTAGRLPQQMCLPWSEPADPHTWADNFLCWDYRRPEEQPQVVATAAVKERGAFGIRKNAIVGGACPAGMHRQSCNTMTQVDSSGWCASDGVAMNHRNQNESLGWVTSDPSDCACRYHVGAAVQQLAHCTIQVAAACAPAHARCGNACCNGAQTCQNGQCVDPAPSPPACETSAGQLSWSCYRAIPGKACIQIHEAADPDTWADNYLCSDTNLGLAWSSAGPIAGQTCTQILEGAEPAAHTWTDNYVCAPRNSSWAFSWSMAGPLPGQQCVQWLEPSDPHTWADNYLCMKRKPVVQRPHCPNGDRCANGRCPDEFGSCGCQPPLHDCGDGRCARFCPR